ncbi:helix-turn-helix domain-containing protein [Oceanirhabdus sp. W0125-5]|uniref:helix-turn-helix domain-containing protein n=1 Tax=Oceanirhabdus sp. W0125-5 TaxID=2999116 RepID=UPI0022F2C039|nr:helix-turn-helix transcriptional regulator [Oceanirhabdus sp. W0125-5]WBW97239.1 helix-turn-helix transcriptional regulator [Oceanirhabdus sp. W0125-5]
MKEINYYFEIGPYLKKLREKKNMSRSQLADGICSVSYIARIENGNRCPSSVILRQISNKLGITPEHLFRAIESPKGLYVQEIINQIMLYVERYDFANLFNLLNDKKNYEHLDILSIHDYQIIQTVKYCSKAFLDNNYEAGIKAAKKMRDLTYIKESTPTDIEFMLMNIYGFFLLLNNQKKESYNYLNKIKKYVDDLSILHTPVAIPRFYSVYISACIDTGNLYEAGSYIDYAIDYCKKNNTHILLRELYFLKGELCYRLGNKDEFKIWYDKAVLVHELCKYTDTEYFILFTENRLKNLAN